jgi:hypothetical protein
MGERPTTKRRRVLIEDARRDGSYLRVTWHPEGRVFVVSTWRDEVCTGAIRVRADASAELAGLLVDGLADAATLPPPDPAPWSLWTTVEAKLRRWFGRRPREATTLRPRLTSLAKIRRSA